MDDDDPDLTDDVAAMIHKVTGENSVFVECYTVVASYTTPDNDRPQLFTWWPDAPKWKLLGMAEGLSEIMRIELRRRYEKED